MMKKVIRIYVITVSMVVAFIILGLYFFRPVPIVEEKDAITVTGVVVDIYEAGVKDVVFKLCGIM